MPSSLQGGLGSSRAGAQSVLLRSERDRQSGPSFFPMGQRPKDNLLRASSYLLQHFGRRYQEWDADGDYEIEGEGETEAESEESSESEMPNLEVCLPPHRLSPPSLLRPSGLAPSAAAPRRPPHQAKAEPISWPLASRSAFS